MDQDHREYLEDRGSHQLEVEAYERDMKALKTPTLIDADRWGFMIENGTIYIVIPERFGALTTIALDLDSAVGFANAILSEVEIAMKGDTG